MYVVEKIKKILIHNLRNLRKERGFKSQEAFAEAIGMSYRGYQDIELGLKWPKATNIEEIAHALSVSPARLFQEERPPDPSPEQALEIISRFIRLNSQKPDA